jgi:hypothetical protein
MIDRDIGQTSEQYRAFCGWRKSIEQHHEFPALKNMLAEIINRPKDRTDIELSIFWNAWRAVTWTPAAQEATERMLAAVQLMLADGTARGLRELAADIDRAGRLGNKFATTAGVDGRQLCTWADALSKGSTAVRDSLGGDVFLSPMQHGPFVIPEKIRGKTRLPSRPTMLAAQIAIMCKGWGLRIDWVTLSKLIAVAGIEKETTAESLRASASKLIKADRLGEVKLVAWPQDVPYVTLNELATSVRVQHLIKDGDSRL